MNPLCQMCKKREVYDPNVRYCVFCEDIIDDAREMKSEMESKYKEEPEEDEDGRNID